MVAHFEIPAAESRMSTRRLALAINAWLPEDIRVLSAARTSKEFHARFDAAGKQYRYFVWNHTAMNPLLRHSAWQVTRPLNLKAMRAAAPLFVGRHDFKSFAASRNYEMESTVRRLTRCDIKKTGRLLTAIGGAAASTGRLLLHAATCSLSPRATARRAQAPQATPTTTRAIRSR